MPFAPLKQSKWFFISLLALSSAAIAGGFWQTFRFDTTPGRPADAKSDWPGASRFPRSTTLPTLVMVIHPNCPCSRASLAELGVLMERAGSRVACDVVFVPPPDFTGDWSSNEYWKAAAAIAGVQPVVDAHDESATLFHANTSGQVFLYDAAGTLRFHGGITGSRGHEGDNDGLSIIETYVMTGKVDHTTTPVFGCALR
jgi:hypothetical protein